MVIIREGTLEPLYDRFPDHLFPPASNEKLLTTAAALHFLGRKFEFQTEVRVQGNLRGGIANRLWIVGGGDPSISGRHHQGQPKARLRELAETLWSRGVREIDGDLLVDDSYFDDERVHSSWPKDQLSRWYCAEVGALSLNDNCVDLKFYPGTRIGAPGRLIISPNGYINPTGSFTTGKRGSASRVIAERILGTNDFRIGGKHPLAGNPFSTSVTITDPGMFFGTIFRYVLEERGIQMSGEVRRSRAPTPSRVLASLTTPISQVVTTTNKRSQNYYAEMLLKSVGKRKYDHGSFAQGARAVSDFLVRDVGVEPDHVAPVDGSGLSRRNRVTPRTIASLLVHMTNHPAKKEFFLSLPVSGQEGSLKKRLVSPKLRGKVAAKTGYITGVGSLSGYLRGAGDETYVFSILMNTSGWISNSVMKSIQDEICRAVYGFSQKMEATQGGD